MKKKKRKQRYVTKSTWNLRIGIQFLPTEMYVRIKIKERRKKT